MMPTVGITGVSVPWPDPVVRITGAADWVDGTAGASADDRGYVAPGYVSGMATIPLPACAEPAGAAGIQGHRPAGRDAASAARLVAALPRGPRRNRSSGHLARRERQAVRCPVGAVRALVGAMGGLGDEPLSARPTRPAKVANPAADRPVAGRARAPSTRSACSNWTKSSDPMPSPRETSVLARRASAADDDTDFDDDAVTITRSPRAISMMPMIAASAGGQGRAADVGITR